MANIETQNGHQTPVNPLSRTNFSFMSDKAQVIANLQTYRDYLALKGKGGPRSIQIREVIDERNGIELNTQNPLHLVIIALMDLPIVQRTRDIGQLGTANFVYKDAVHVRFGHLIGSGYLASDCLQTMRNNASHTLAREIEKYAPAVVATTVLHDIGHFAPRSHLGESVWFPKDRKAHEKTTLRILDQDEGLKYVLQNIVPRHEDLYETVRLILRESDKIPAWTWKLVSGGGWNLDRGDWVYRDSLECGVEYGRYGVKPLLKRLSINEDGELTVDEGGARLIQHFFQSRYEMYEHVYFHSVSRLVIEMYKALVNRARELDRLGKDFFQDPVMKEVLHAERSEDVPLDCLLKMTDSWFKYHLERWAESSDYILADLASRLILRQLFKHFPDDEYHRRLLTKWVVDAGLPLEYYLLEVPPYAGSAKKDLAEKALRVVGSDGSLQTLAEHDVILDSYTRANMASAQPLLAIPHNVVTPVNLVEH
ncbi:MAG: hypothetical protein R3A13_00010 [Bdellovibrionota bacterium]